VVKLTFESSLHYANKDGDKKISLQEFMECIDVFWKRYSSSSVKEVDDTTFEMAVHNAGHPVFLEAYTSYCNSCQTLAPVWEDLGKAFEKSTGVQRVHIAKIDATTENMRNRLKIDAFPTLLFYAEP